LSFGPELVFLISTIKYLNLMNGTCRSIPTELFVL
jgi:hypothetical protein